MDDLPKNAPELRACAPGKGPWPIMIVDMLDRPTKPLAQALAANGVEVATAPVSQAASEMVKKDLQHLVLLAHPPLVEVAGIIESVRLVVADLCVLLVVDRFKDAQSIRLTDPQGVMITVRPVQTVDLQHFAGVRMSAKDRSRMSQAMPLALVHLEKDVVRPAVPDREDSGKIETRRYQRE